jgi:hypothetical protein
MKNYENRHKVVKSEGKNAVVDGDPKSSDNEWRCMEISEGPGSVRVSVSIGHSEDYGRNKFTVTVDHGLACGQTESDKERAFNEAKSFCVTKVESLRKEVISSLFEGR